MGAATCTQRKENPSTDLFNSPEWKEFQEYRKTKAPDIIGCDRDFFDLTEKDLPTALMLDDICFWHMPTSQDNTNSKNTKLGVYRDGVYWLARKRTDWEHIGLSSNQIRYSIKKLKDKGWINTKITCINASKEKHTLIRLTEKFIHDINNVRTKKQNGKFRFDTSIKTENSPLTPLSKWKIPPCTPIKGKNSPFLYTSLIKESLFEDTSLGECSPNSIRLRKEIGEKAKQVLLSWEQVHNPVALLKGYENLWADTLVYVQEKYTVMVETDIPILNTYCDLLGITPTPETRKRLESIWNHFECDRITYPYAGAERSILLILLFVLRQKAPGWLPSDIEPENLDSVLWALLAYYEKHHEELEFPA